MKKVLVIDDQALVVLSLKKLLTDLGYNTVTSNNVTDGISVYNDFHPDLVITDINMPLSEVSPQTLEEPEVGCKEAACGLEVVKYIKQTKKDKTPVLFLSGNTSEEIIARGFELGADDYVKKPVSLSEIAARVKRFIGIPNMENSSEVIVGNNDRYIQKGCIGVVIPCYNEETRLLSEEFKSFIRKNLGYHLCFVNDGSKDNTLAVLEELRKGNEDYISIYDCKNNGGKAEAVRLGMLHLVAQNEYDYIGFLDADLSTNFDDFQDLATTIFTTKFQIVSGSRMSRMGANITKESARAIISKTINFIIRKMLGMEINDTQCGAKIMTKEVIEKTCQTPFLTKWLFDVEIFMRMKKVYGQEAKKMICEQPLKRWIHADGSKLSMKDSIKILFQLFQIAIHYR